MALMRARRLTRALRWLIPVLAVAAAAAVVTVGVGGEDEAKDQLAACLSGEGIEPGEVRSAM
jgi:hypothetical protein